MQKRHKLVKSNILEFLTKDRRSSQQKPATSNPNDISLQSTKSSPIKHKNKTKINSHTFLQDSPLDLTCTSNSLLDIDYSNKSSKKTEFIKHNSSFKEENMKHKTKAYSIDKKNNKNVKKTKSNLEQNSDEKLLVPSLQNGEPGTSNSKDNNVLLGNVAALMSKKILGERLARHCRKQFTILEVLKLLLHHHLSIPEIRAIVASSVTVNGYTVLQIPDSINRIKVPDLLLPNGQIYNGDATLKMLLAQPSCSWVFTILASVIPQCATSTVTIQGSCQEIFKSLVTVENILKEAAILDNNSTTATSLITGIKK